ncbi:CPBP family intramembrane glutamic endopeptidase [Porphyromonas asaccharolytica]|uniref:CPBP family intramembrane glutamic endopeptidase n=1 Tax=Porphyromonas asaccharolytica TaxID=28123 RepID=UPI00248D8755|nr:CPBP family intramembrane glutamic endopeptidase [Porphyromonas asaccharolytica]
MLVLLLLYSLILFVVTYPLLPVSWVGVIAFGGSALLASWTYLWGYRWLYRQPAPQEPSELLALPLEPLRRYLKGVKPVRCLLYAILAVLIYLLLTWGNEALVAVWPEGWGGAWLRNWSKLVEEAQTTLIEESNIGWSLLIVGVLTPIAEELFFRGALMGWMMLRHFPRWSVILLPALLFTVMHLNPVGMLPIFFLALLLGHLRWAADSLWPSVALHMLNNLLVLGICGL